MFNAIKDRRRIFRKSQLSPADDGDYENLKYLSLLTNRRFDFYFLACASFGVYF